MMDDWSRDKEKKVLRKYRFTLTTRVLRVLLVCIAIYSIYIMGISIVFNKIHPDRQHIYYSMLALEWQQPNIKSPFFSGSSADISPLLTQKYSSPLIKQVGKEDVVVGEMHMEKRLWNSFSSMTMDLPPDKPTQKLSFHLPEDPKTGKATVAYSNDRVWKTLDKLPEGTVAEFAFSTTTFMEPVELMRMLASFDVHIVWMPLYTGEFKSFEPKGYGSGNGSLTVYDRFGLSGGMKVSDDFSTIREARYLSNSIQDSQRWMLENMENLLKHERKSYYEKFLGLSHLQERFDFLKDNGFQVYGAVVTGPTKELLKLRDVEGISNEILGEIDFWNWDD